MKKIFIGLTLLWLATDGKTQAMRKLKIGQQVPASVWKTIPRKTTTQLVILDCWASNCSSCVEAFPVMAALQQKFDKKLQVVMVNTRETVVEAKDFFAREGGHIVLPNLPAIYKSLALTLLFPNIWIPHHVWINGQGKVVAITGATNTNEKNIRAYFEGKSLDLPVKDDSLTADLNKNGVFGTRYKTGTPIFYSAFMPYDPNSGQSDFIKSRDTVNHRFESSLRGSNIASLYYFAFQLPGKRRIINETGDADLMDNRKMDALEWRKKYCFSYEIQIPSENKGSRQQNLAGWEEDENKCQDILRKDINLFLGPLVNIEGGLEKRKFNCLLLVKEKDRLLKAGGGEQAESSTDSGFSLTNYDFKDFVSQLNDTYHLEDASAGRFLIDETGIDNKLKVDITISGDVRDIPNLRKQLKTYGLDLIEAEREVEVLVLKRRTMK